MSQFSHPDFKVGTSEEKGLSKTFTIGLGDTIPSSMAGAVSFIILQPAVLVTGNLRSRGLTMVTGDYGNWVLGVELSTDGYTSIDYFIEKIAASPRSIKLWNENTKEWHPWVTTIWEAWTEIKERIQVLK